MKGEIELYNISFLILKVELHFKYHIFNSLELSGQDVFLMFTFVNL